eukprot:6473236-Amphidinium_carterae.3
MSPAPRRPHRVEVAVRQPDRLMQGSRTARKSLQTGPAMRWSTTAKTAQNDAAGAFVGHQS